MTIDTPGRYLPKSLPLSIGPPFMLNPDAIEVSEPTAREWVDLLAEYRTPDASRGIYELAITVLPLAGLWWLAWMALSVSVWLTLLIAVPTAGLLVRLFLIQHDCGHGSFFRKRVTNDWVGRILGVFTLTPYDVWKRSHAVHHATSGNLDHRGTGDIRTLTVKEYQALGRWERLKYRLYRHPLVMFGLGPGYVFVLQNRLPFGYFSSGWLYWTSAMATNLAIAAFILGMIYLVGAGPFFIVHGPIVLLAATMGIWLFYVQHQFEDTTWESDAEWNVHEAALHGSSYYDLPCVLRWFTANIGVHHVHHLCSRIPYYRLDDVLDAHPELKDVKRVTLWESFKYTKLHLWDETEKRLVSFRDVRSALA